MTDKGDLTKSMIVFGIPSLTTTLMTPMTNLSGICLFISCIVVEISLCALLLIAVRVAVAERRV
jgi:hypothetical protein